MLERVRYLLLQVRNPDDPMRTQEVRCFARALSTTTERIDVADLLQSGPSRAQLQASDVMLLGGSGHYSVTGEGDWLDRTFDLLRDLHARRRPTFASCWGFQAMARALGGRMVNDLSRAEVGTHQLVLTPAGQDDPVFGPLGSPFDGQMGHEDCVDELPPGAVLLASSDKVVNQAYRLHGAPIYCTQFHPELNCADLLERVRQYPEYIERIAGVPPDHFREMISDTPGTEALLLRFVRHVLA